MKPLATSADNDIVDQLLASLANCLTPATARHIVAFRAEAETQGRIADLAEKCNQGELSPAERAEYAEYVRVIDLISILQAKARARLAKSRHAR